MNHTIFDDIVSGKMKSWKIWEDEKFLAFLTPFPNTPGFTVVIPKYNPGDYVFSLDDNLYSEMMLAVKKVAGILEKAFDTPRVALIFEGTGVAHVHAKLISRFMVIWQRELVRQCRTSRRFMRNILVG
ncbi:HIT family protein [Candidatus Minimicrobia vallesae]|uniref:HIT family protein n=1 Tax=Candidatus Minimicrobia vallesae TaxID=2841264 RepID=A0A8F1MAS6_9BACT|nr:HIT family protein [Candidatus Minimicrobia vallesae]QWQ31188.1 HIT family protein [Candidatus Minimicrobia vallesae]